MYYSKEFTQNEVMCRCGCGTVVFVEQHYFRMMQLRRLWNKPIVVTSWCRCETNNTEVGGSKTSSHLSGLATDIKAINPHTRLALCFYAGLCQFRGIGIGENFIHLDSDFSKPANRFWIY